MLLKRVKTLQRVFRSYMARKKAKKPSYCAPSRNSRVNGTNGAEEVPKTNEEELEYKENYKFPNGAVYTGQWKNGMRHGYGTQVWPDGAKYEGFWKDNQACGKGKFWHIDGDIFEGEWRADKANGYGTYIHKNGAKYEGNWKDDFQDGYGAETWADGSKYEGYYSNGKKHGRGTYCWPDCSKYAGDWEDNKINGKVFSSRHHASIGSVHVGGRQTVRGHVEEQQHGRRRRLHLGRRQALRRFLP